jgi:hypothetical protein
MISCFVVCVFFVRAVHGQCGSAFSFSNAGLNLTGLQFQGLIDTRALFYQGASSELYFTCAPNVMQTNMSITFNTDSFTIAYENVSFLFLYCL